MARRARQTHLPGMEPEEPAQPVLTVPVAPPPASERPVAGTSNAAGIKRAPSSSPESLAGKSVWVLDANSLIYQVFHAIPEMTGPRGEPVNAVFGLTRDLLFLLESKKPDYLLAAFDLPEPTFRHELYPAYKAQRAETPDELIAQLPAIRALFDALAIPVLEVPGYEADDILATLAAQTSGQGAKCYLVSGDKDCRQLLSPQVKIFNIRKNQEIDEQALHDDWGVRPEQVVDFQALVGDAVDNVPGVPGIGPKGARELLSAYGTLEGVLSHIDEISGDKRRQMLRDHGEQARLSRQLTQLSCDVPFSVDWARARAGQFDGARAAKLLASFGFRTLTERARQLGGAEVQAWQADYRAVHSLDELRSLAAAWQRAELLAIDTETTDIAPMRAELVGLSLSAAAGEGWYVPIRAPLGEPVLPLAGVIEVLRPVLEDPRVPKLGQNLKYDLLVLRRNGVRVAGLAADTMVASYLLDSGQRNHNLDDLARRYLQHENIPITELIGSAREQRRMDAVPLAQITEYAAEDVDVPQRLWPLLRRQLEEELLWPLFRDLELPLIDVLAELEFNGIRVDVARLAELSARFGERLASLEQEIYELAGCEFNIASPKQLQQVLFEKHRLPVGKKTKTGPSTDADVLEELARFHPLPAKILEYRQFAKLKNTYVDALPTMVHPQTGRVHASFNQVVAATGRLSSSDPNLQNIPIRTESGRDIRSAFLPGPQGWVLVAADYSQIELRMLAHFSQDETLCAAFERDEDIHALVASQVHGVPLAEVTSAQRRTAKAVNFGIIYGQSPFGLAKQLGIEQQAAATFIDQYFARYPGVERFMTQVLVECQKTGYVKTILGRRRAIEGVRVDGGRQRNLPERTAINTVIQGSAADLIKKAMLVVYEALREAGLAARMLLQIHDELVFESPPSEQPQLIELLVRTMTSVLPLRVPLKVDVKTGRNWSDVEPWS